MADRRNAGDDVPGGTGTMQGEHEAEIALLDAVEVALRQGRSDAEVSAALQQLVDHTSAHFMSEQLLMRLYAYPQYEAHNQEHDRLMEQAGDLQQRFAAAGGKVSPALVADLRRWLLDHMAGHDRALEKYLDRCGAAPTERR